MRTHYCSTARLSLILVMIGLTAVSLVFKTVSVAVLEDTAETARVVANHG